MFNDLIKLLKIAFTPLGDCKYNNYDRYEDRNSLDNKIKRYLRRNLKPLKYISEE